VLGRLILAAIGTSTVIAPSISTGTLALPRRTSRLIGRRALTGLALAHGYDTAFWRTAGIFARGAVIVGALLRPGAAW
jgi:hypothetical protein